MLPLPLAGEGCASACCVPSGLPLALAAAPPKALLKEESVPLGQKGGLAVGVPLGDLRGLPVLLRMSSWIFSAAEGLRL